MSLLAVIIFGVIIFLTNTVQAITGFGGAVLAMPFAVFIFGVRTLVPTFITLSLIINTCIFLVSHRYCDFKKYLTMVIFMGAGIPFGVYLFDKAPERILEIIIAIFIVIIAIRELYYNYHENIEANLNNKVLKFILFLAGCVHGAFGIGGPLVVVYTSQTIKDKKAFRATLNLLWISLNGFLVLRNLYRGIITPEVMRLVGYVLPFLMVGAFTGNQIHHKVNNEVFRKGVYFLLLLSGLFMYFA